MKYSVQSIFPTPIYVSNIDRPYTKQELEFVNQQKKYCVTNEGNTTTKNNYILKTKELKNINKFLEQHCQNYLQQVICPANNVELYITQSWLNYTYKDQYHHKHEHPNSIISGVLYFNSDIQNDKILFTTNKGYEQIAPKTDDKKYNLWNSKTWFFPVKTGQLYLFPSSTTHQVETKQGNNTRISLAFNTFYKGTIGSNSDLTELIL